MSEKNYPTTFFGLPFLRIFTASISDCLNTLKLPTETLFNRPSLTSCKTRCGDMPSNFPASAVVNSFSSIFTKYSKTISSLQVFNDCDKLFHVLNSLILRGEYEF